jgi:hypothetical protein
MSSHLENLLTFFVKKLKKVMGYKEKNLINERLLNLKPNERLFRSNAGMAWTGKVVRHDGSMIILKNPRPFHGMPEGWPDLTGWTEIEITPDMVGQKIAVFTAEEVKATGDLTEKQTGFKKIIDRMGGIFRTVRTSQP